MLKQRPSSRRTTSSDESEVAPLSGQGVPLSSSSLSSSLPLSSSSSSSSSVIGGSPKAQQQKRLKRKRKSFPESLTTPALGAVLCGLVLVIFYELHRSIPKGPLRIKSIKERPILTAYLEKPSTLDSKTKPLPPRITTSKDLQQQQFPRVQKCSTFFEMFPVDQFPTEDPFLPWIHDLFPSSDGKYVQVVAQNKRRCATGKGFESKMEFWEPQMALLQPVPVLIQNANHNTTQKIRLASSMDEATVKETRFICRFHTIYDNTDYETTLSQFPFNYEYVSWRKGKKSLFEKEGKDNTQFWLSQLLFKCPIPEPLQNTIKSGRHVQADMSHIFLDIVPIRTPPRQTNPLFTPDHIGQENIDQTNVFDLPSEFGTNHYLPNIEDSGRWANIPICQPPKPPPRKNKLVACTWTAAAYTRRGDVVGIDDTETRLREWILYLRMVGFDHVYVYDNTSPHIKESSLLQITQEFPGFADYHRWPYAICNNNRPSHKNPGDRSSQYAAEASCRERYGPSTEWMSFLDTDEYLVPMGDHQTWTPLLDSFTERGISILKMRSSRAKPRVEYMEPLQDQSKCVDPVPNTRKPPGKMQDCLVPMRNETFFQVYNCEFIKPPRPERFERAMKQIYRPDHVQSHYVHYSTVTTDVSKLRKDFGPDETFVRLVHRKDFIRNAPEVFLDEINEGMLVHTRSVLPHESQYRDQGCQLNSKWGCSIGVVCPDDTEFDDEKHKDNVFTDHDGKYCNCWRNPKADKTFIPKLNQLLKEHMDKISKR